MYNPIFLSSDIKVGGGGVNHNVFTVILKRYQFPKIFKACVMCFIRYVIEIWLEMLSLLMYDYYL